MSKANYYVEQSMEDALRMQPIFPMDWDSMTMVLPYQVGPGMPAAVGAGKLPPSSYYESPEAYSMQKPIGQPVYPKEFPAEHLQKRQGGGENNMLYVLGIVLLVGVLYSRRG